VSASKNGHARNPERERVRPVPMAALPPGSDTQSEVWAAHDLIQRRRDAHGNRLGSVCHYTIPTVDDVPVEQTPLITAIEKISEQHPILGALLQHAYQHKLQTRRCEAREIRQEEERRRTEHNQRAVQENAKIERQQEQLQKAQERATRADRAALRALDAPLLAAHQQAAARVAHVGGLYDPGSPDEACVLRHVPRAPEAIAADLRLPWTPSDKIVQMATIMSYFLSALIGTMIGLSVGIMMGLLEPDNLGAQPAVVGFCAFFGFAVALAVRHAVKGTCRQAAQRYYLGVRWPQWLPYVIVALLVAGVIVLMDSFVEQQGLLANRRAMEAVLSLSPHGPPASSASAEETLSALAAILFTFPYVVCSVVDGYRCGRADASMNLIRSRQAAEFAEIDAERRGQSQVQAALAALAQVKIALHYQALLTARIAAAEVPYLERLATLEAQRLGIEEELNECGKQRVQDGFDNFAGAQAEFDALFAEGRFACEPPGRGLRLAWQMLRGYRPPRRRCTS
jgi:hypothetical protein